MSTVGTIHSNFSGMEHTSAQFKAGYRLSLEREPGNRHDTNAIKVINGSESLGYINRQDSLWLAPLMDDWLIEMKAALLNYGSVTGTPVELIVKTTSRGDSMLSPNRGDSPQAVLHNALLTVYFNLDGYSMDTLKKVLLQYSNVMGDVRLLPETQLIFNIIATRLKELEACLIAEMDGSLEHLSPYKTIKQNHRSTLIDSKY